MATKPKEDYMLLNVFLLTAGCVRGGAVLRAQSGTFGIHSYEYQDAMVCRWTIQVDINRVSHFNVCIILSLLYYTLFYFRLSQVGLWPN